MNEVKRSAPESVRGVESVDDVEPVIRLGVSTCLLGERVRYDGGHKRDRFITDVLAQFMALVPVCPEVECGLSIPRESMRLVGDPESPRLIAPRSGMDYTAQMQAWAETRLEALAAENLHGFIFKKDSPSSGLFRVKVYNDDSGMPRRVGRGVFAKAFTECFPLLPVEEEGRLNDWRLRENFIERVFVYWRWHNAETRFGLRRGPAPGELVRFHTSMKMTMLAHSPQHYREMGSLVAQAGTSPWDEVRENYGRLLMKGMAVMATPGRHTNVMQHLMGFLKDALSNADKAELLGLIEDYRRGLVPLIVPLTLLKHHVARHPVPDWVHQQVYLHPYPKELMLRNHV
jgi:uncharacterized protein YbgA (DUF1722 family)/uncharacterized protein YbbK (DUF523 family)